MLVLSVIKKTGGLLSQAARNQTQGVEARLGRGQSAIQQTKGRPFRFHHDDESGESRDTLISLDTAWFAWRFFSTSHTKQEISNSNLQIPKELQTQKAEESRDRRDSHLKLSDFESCLS